MEDEENETMATSDSSPTPHTVPHVESSTDSTSVQAPKILPQNESLVDKEQEPVVIAKDDIPTSTSSTKSNEQGEGDVLATESQENPAEEAEDLLVVVEEQGAQHPSFPPEDQAGMIQAGEEESAPSGVSIVSMPAPSIAMEPNVQLQRSRSETDASLSGVPSVDVASPVSEETSNLQEFLSSPHGNNQIVERSPGGRYVRFIEKLGSGASKDVYRAYDTEEGIEVAWNVVHLAGVPKNERNRIVNEVRLLERLHHQNIISFHGSWVNRERQQVNFVTEILSSGTLKSFINKVQVIRWKIAKRWAVQILKGLEYLHSQDPPVIHRDLKCENIFINGTSGDLRIGDLGLSTVHRNGKVLSVLGTPEFMAPDMYEEGSYDEKVDIYAFGMCLLEIFTKEIPYRECNNPAQIYKKVMRGAPPDSLARLKSTHAREFIELCMGHKNEDGTYNRPSATELLAHPFLIKRANDDDEVEVEPLLQEQPIREVSGSNENPSDGIRSKTTPSVGSGQVHTNGPATTGSSPNMRPHDRKNSLEEDESDRFEEMPDSEVNSIRKVKVMMGRGEELKESEETNKNPNQAKAASPEAPPSEEIASTSSKQNAQKNETEPSKLHYLVAAAVIEGNEQTQFQQPYPDDVLKLVVTLPVEGQTQNVQFDFHLVEDDPIQVAKEMVAELGIPQGAVLEISETISSLARAARTKKHNFTAAQAQRSATHPGHGRSHSQSIGSAPSNMQQQAPPPQGSGTLQHQQQPPQHLSQHSVQEYVQQPPPTHQQPPQHHHQQISTGQDQSFQHSMQPQGIPYQDQAHHLQGQQSLGQSASVSSQMHQMQAQQVGIGSGEGDSRQPQYSQPGFQGHPQSLPSNPNIQQQSGLVNGEYHQHPDAKIQQATGYSHLQPPPSMSARSVSNANSQTLQHQTSSHQQGSQQNNLNPAEGAYSAAPQNHIQQIHASAPGVNIGNGVQQQGTSSYQTGQHDTAHLPQYQYAQQQGQPSQGVQSGVPAHHTIAQTQQQQFQGGHPAMPQGYGQSIPQQGLAHPVAAGHPQQLQQQQHGQNVPQHPQAMQQQQPHGASQHQLVQPTQPMQTQQHQMNMQQHHHQLGQQPGMVQHMQQSQLAMTHSVPVHPQHHQMQDLGQHGVSAAAPSSLNHADELKAEDRAPAAQPIVPVASTTPNNVDGTDGTIDRSSEPQGGIGERMAEIQRDSLSDSSIGALGGLPMDNWSDEELDEEGDLCAEELRKLDEDFKKNMMRAKKVFVNRMDNLQRTQVQREAQHKKTLEQHQKDRAAFEKRLQQEEIEQNRRIEQMRKEWDRRREELRLKQLSDERSLSSTPPTEGMLSDGRTSAAAAAPDQPFIPER
jgi:WNK lysine deficient protein kinase